MTHHRQEGRQAARISGRRSGLSLDFKIGFRMLARNPGITVLAGLAMALAIAICTATFELVAQLRQPNLDLEEQDRLVAIRLLDTRNARARNPQLRDFDTWREELTSIEQLGAFREVERNLVIPNGSAAPVTVAEITAAGFQAGRVTPLFGRPLLQEDERTGAPAVVVIGYDLWQTRFLAAPNVVGETVRIGEEEATVVGVMPEGFAFPVTHAIWMPLRVTLAEASSALGTRIWVFGRLASGASIESAQAELTTLVARADVGSQNESPQLRPQVVSYPRAFLDVSIATAYSVNFSVVMFLLLLCANVALLLFVRVATREGEMVVRTALGASRRRIVLQLVTEALVLAMLSGLLGLGLAALAVKWGVRAYQLIITELPFWISDSLSLRSIVYAAVFTVLCAVVSGTLPALNATNRELQTRLREWGIGGTTMRLGRIWSVTIVVQVALVVAYVPIFLRLGLDTYRIRTTELGVDASEYLVAHISTGTGLRGIPGDTSAGASARLVTTYNELKERLEAEPGVARVAFASSLPGEGGSSRRLEQIEGITIAPQSVVHATLVDLDYFDALDIPMVAGRSFRSGDLQPGANTVIVNESFAREYLGGRMAIGQRIRYRQPGVVMLDMPVPELNPEQWHEIVGVVKDMRISLDPLSRTNAGVYHPAVARTPSPTNPSPGLEKIVLHVNGEPASFSSSLRAVAAEVDANLRLYDVRSLSDVRRDLLVSYASGLQLALAAGGLASILALSGVYSILSFTVLRRTREIGIRLALGASGWRVVSTVLGRALAQVGIGVIAGGLVLAVFESQGRSTLTGVPILVVSFALLLSAGIAACTVPVKRALRIQPTEAIATGG